MKTILQTILFFIILSTNLKAQNIDATLLEINFSGDGNPKNITKGNTNIYFSAEDGIHGRELWVYNSITNSSSMVKDIFADSQSGLEYSNFVTINDQLYFNANDGINGNELWTSDGTEAGTFLIKNINNTGDSNIGKLKAFNNNIYFSANDNVSGQELWISDGTTNGTTLLKDINIGNNSSYPTDFFVFNNNIFFICNNGINGVELWESDGTNSGTTLLKDINLSSYSSINPGNNFIIFDNNFYFFANNGTTGCELWKSDGTTSGTQLLKDIYTGTNSSSYTMVGSATNNYFVFGARTATTGNELWKSDGTTSGTILLKDINSTYDGIYYSSEFVTFNNSVYFTAENDINGKELWITDGTTIGTQIVKDINVGINSSSISKLTSTSNFIIFSATDSSTNYNTLWKSDGTSNGTSQIKNINLSQFSNTELDFVELNNLIFFVGEYNSANGIELWKTDGTFGNTLLVSNTFHKYGNSYGNKDFIAFNNKLIFAGTDGIHGSEPFITDGTIEGTKMIKDINPNYSSIYNDYDYRPSFTKAGNNVFFRATNGTSGFELFKTDGTELGTSLVKDIVSGSTSSIGEYTLFMSLNDIVFFRANDQIHGEELWRSDGTEQGTYLLKDINPGAGHGVTSSNLFYNHDNILNENCFAILNGYLYFIGRDSAEYGIWKTDGSTAGTSKVISIPSSGNYDYRPEIINAANGKIFFKTDINNSSYGNNSLWSTDGTQAGTALLGSWLISGPVQFKKNIIFNNELYFTVYSNNGPTLMKSDGTQIGTVAVTNPNFTSYYTFNSLKTCGNFVYFATGQDGATVGKELWRTDGTNNGTVLIEQIPLVTPNYFADCTCIQNNLFFIKEFYSDKVWYVNNNLQSTNFFQINILNSNNFSNYYGVSDINNLNNNLLFDGITQESGNELYYSNIQSVLNTENYTNENVQFNKIKVYPNPSNGYINLLISDNSKLTNIYIYNTLGENIFNLKPESSNSIDLSTLNSGIYFIKIITENYYEIKKIIIK
jgi:ELWxxDGT repeat protein